MLEVGLNITYLVDVLQNMATERVQLAFGDANSSALVTLPGSTSSLGQAMEFDDGSVTQRASD